MFGDNYCIDRASLSAFGKKAEKRKKIIFVPHHLHNNQENKNIPKSRLLLEEPTIMSSSKSCDQILRQKFRAIPR
jgi:hypothetical protein